VWFTALALVSAGLMQAQATADARWSAWIGCWRTADADAATTCVIPTARPSAVDVVTIVNGEIASRQRIDADGQPHAIDHSGCHGFEMAAWSPTGHRVYRRDDLVCPGGVNGMAMTLMAISPSGEWLNIEGVRAGAGSLERLDRFHDVGLPSSIPKETRAAISRRQLASTTARAAAAAPITEADVTEASASVDAGVVRSWLAEAGAAPAVVTVMAPVIQNPPAQSQTMIQETAPPESQYDSNCGMPTGCYPNPYSAYNGYSAYPYGPFSPFFGSPFGFGFGLPFIVTHRTNRPQVIFGHQQPPQRGQPHGQPHGSPRGQPMRPIGPPMGPRHEPARITPTVRGRP
jgi:hypothetical protein